MSYGNFNYETRFTAVGSMMPAINESVQGLDMLRGSVDRAGTSARQAAKDFQGLNSSVSTGAMGNFPKMGQSISNVNSQLMSMRGALFGVQMGMFYVSMLTSSMMQLESASNNVEGAQERLTKVIREGGRGTLEYRNAVRQLENAQINLQRTQASVNIMTASMGLQMVSMAVSFYQAIPAISAMITKLQTYVATSVTAQALTPGVGWGTLAVGLGVAAAAGGTVGYLIGNQGQTQGKQQVNVEVVTTSPYDSFLRQNRTKAVTSGVG
ncbi:MAG: hypothetical protein WC365_06185 [Candidatus Babeliales bacterium]|jgi:hypothetical protein